ncbi:MAG: hypothetical protein SP4CHLAM5_02170 [Chlamydiia bacterium]|nr:hypothetical protein [Chlamydiia bacterium]MCH9618091.1 hypothetical protein [Chlamydiia bacterium]
MSKNFNEGLNHGKDALNRIYSKGDQKALHKHGFLYPVEEANDFHDPFSKLSLFLAKRLKKEIVKKSHPKKWSQNIQKTLLAEVLPEFREHFPHYRLGISALKKTWEKIHYYVKYLEKHYAYSQNGKLDISYLIRENLSLFFEKELPASTASFHFAHHITGKISECIAAIDGESIEKSKLTKVIWAMQKQLIPTFDKTASPYESIDTLDKLLIRFQLEIIAESPLLAQSVVQEKLLGKIKGLLSINRIRNFRELTPQISSIIADKMYPASPLHSFYDKESLKIIEAFICAEHTRILEEEKKITAPGRLSFAKRILFVLRIKETLGKKEAISGLKSAIEYIYSLRSSDFNLGKPVIRKEIFHFLNSEILLAEKKGIKNIKNYLLNLLISLFDRMAHLPSFPVDNIPMLEIVVWKNLKEDLQDTWKIPSHLIHTIEDEIAGLYLDHAKLPFPEIVELSIKHLKRISELKGDDLNDRTHYWSIQNLTLAAHLKFSQDHPIFKILKEEMKSFELRNLSHAEIIETITKKFLKKHPGLIPWKNSIRKRVSLYYLYYHFAYLKGKNETPFDRFQKWHLHSLSHDKQTVFKEFYMAELSSITRSLLPYIPFVEAYVGNILHSEEKKASGS